MNRYCQKRALKLDSYSAFLTVLIERIVASGKLVVLHLLIMRLNSLKLCLPVNGNDRQSHTLLSFYIFNTVGSHITYHSKATS